MTLPEKPRLVVLDVEGVMVPRNRFFFEVAKTQSFTHFLRLLFWGFLYETGLLKLESALRHIYGAMRGVEKETLLEVFTKISAPVPIQGICGQLKARNCKIAVISSGIPTFALDKLAVAICADYLYGVDTELAEGRLTGEICGEAITKNGKYKILTDILAKEGLTLSDCIVVADDRNNSCIFLPEILKIGFNADFVIRIKADHVVMGKLQNILPVIDGKPHKWSFPSANDLVREDIHAAGFFMPVIAGFIGVPIVAAIIIAITLIYTVSELYRLDGRSIPVISAVTRHAASQSELFGFAAAPLYFAFGIVATLLLFPWHIAGAAIAIFCLGDSVASLFGGIIPITFPFNKGKTLEGSLAGFLFAFLAGSFFVPPIYALIGAAIAMTVEALPLPINDNVLIPIITGAALWIIF